MKAERRKGKRSSSSPRGGNRGKIAISSIGFQKHSLDSSKSSNPKRFRSKRNSGSKNVGNEAAAPSLVHRYIRPIGGEWKGGGEGGVWRKLLGGKYRGALLGSWDYRNASCADLLAGNSVAKLVQGLVIVVFHVKLTAPSQLEKPTAACPC